MFSFLTNKELARYLEDAFKNDIAKNAFERLENLENLDSKNLTDVYLDKSNSGKMEDPVNYKSSGLVYVNLDKDSYTVFVLMPGVSKDDILITYVENGGCKHLKIALDENVDYEYSKYFSFLKNIDKVWKIDLPNGTSTPMISMDNGVLKIECAYVNREKEIKLDIQ